MLADADPVMAPSAIETDPARSADVREALIFTRWAIVDLPPAALERVAATLDAIRNREPMRSGASWASERQVLGCLVTDLQAMVLAAGEPVGAQRDLRDARTRQDEVYARQRAEGAIRAYHQEITEAIEDSQRRRGAPDPELDQIVFEDPAPAPVRPAAVEPADGSIPAW